MLTLRFPSAVMRSRLQVPQKCSDMDVMKLTWPWKPGILKAYGRRWWKGQRGLSLTPGCPLLMSRLHSAALLQFAG